MGSGTSLPLSIRDEGVMRATCFRYCRLGKQTEFHATISCFTLRRWCWACNTHNCDLHNAACRWCSLYETEHTSIELKQYELELQDRRDAISNYNTNAYDQFVREHIQRYFDLHQFTLTHVLIPMLGYVEDGHVQRDRQRLRDNETLLQTFQPATQLFWC